MKDVVFCLQRFSLNDQQNIVENDELQQKVAELSLETIKEFEKFFRNVNEILTTDSTSGAEFENLVSDDDLAVMTSSRKVAGVQKDLSELTKNNNVLTDAGKVADFMAGVDDVYKGLNGFTQTAEKNRTDPPKTQEEKTARVSSMCADLSQTVRGLSAITESTKEIVNDSPLPTPVKYAANAVSDYGKLAASCVNTLGCYIATTDGATAEEKKALAYAVIETAGEAGKILVTSKNPVISIAMDIPMGGWDIADSFGKAAYDIYSGERDNFWEAYQEHHDEKLYDYEHSNNLKDRAIVGLELGLARILSALGDMFSEGDLADLEAANAENPTTEESVEGGTDDSVNGGGQATQSYQTNEKYGTEGNDIIEIYSRSKIIAVFSGAGNDIIRNYNDGTRISSGKDNDLIENYGKDARIYAGSGDDRIFSSGNGGEIYAGSGNDTIRAQVGSENDLLIDSGDGNNGISVTGYNSGATIGGNVLIQTGSGNNGIDLYGTTFKNVYISSGYGNDRIELDAENVCVDVSGGNNGITTHHSRSVEINVSASNNEQNCIVVYEGKADIRVNGGDASVFIQKQCSSANIVTGAGDDYISSKIDGTNVSSGNGNDTVFVGAHAIVNTGAGEDKIGAGDNSHVTAGTGAKEITVGDNSQINAVGGNSNLHAGNNSHVSAGLSGNYIGVENNSVVVTGAGNNIISSGNYAQITAGAGNNSIETGDYSQINADVGNDTIVCGSYSIVNAGKSDNYLSTSSSNVTLNAEDGNDSVLLKRSENVVVNAGDGDNAITVKSSSAITLNTGSNDDRILLYDDPPYQSWNNPVYTPTPNTDIVVNAGAGNNTIDSRYVKNSKIITEGGNDSVYGCSNSTVNTGAGNDTLELSSSVLADAGVDDDIIKAYNNSIIYAGSGNDTVSLSGYNSGFSTVYSDEGDDYVYTATDDNLIIVDIGNNTVLGSGKNIVVSADGERSGNNFVSVAGGTVNSGAGNDTIIASGYINTGEGNDSLIISKGTVNSGAGDDTINVEGESIFITAGTGEDIISLSYSVCRTVNYAQGDGDDTVFGLNASDTLSITKGNYSTVKNDDDLIVKVGTSSITLMDAANKNIFIDGSYEEETNPPDNPPTTTFTEGNDHYENTTPNTILSGLGGNDSIHNWAENVTISGGAGNDSIRIESGSRYNSIDGGADNDIIHNEQADNVTIYGGDGNDSIETRGAGTFVDGGKGNDSIAIFLGESDTLTTIFGGDDDDWISNEGRQNVIILAGEGNDTVGNRFSNVTIDGGEGHNHITNSFEINTENVSIKAGSGNDTVVAWGSNPIIDVGDGDNSIYYYGINFDVANNTLAPSALITAGNGKDYLHLGGFGTVNMGAGNDTVYGGYRGTVESFLNALTVIDLGAGDDNIDYVGENPTSIISSSGNNFVGTWHGSKTTVLTGSGNDTIHSGNSYNYLETGEGHDSIVNEGGADDYDENNHGGEYSTIKSGKGNDTVDNLATSVLIETDEGNDVVLLHGSQSKNSTINTGTGDDTVRSFYRSSESNSINSGEGNDYIELLHGGKNNTITSGTGKDTIEIDMAEVGTTIIDFDVNDVLYVNNLTYAKFENGVLNVGGVEINLPNVENINDYRDMVVKNWSSDTTLGALLDGPVSHWTVDGTTAVYGTSAETYITVNGVSSTATPSDFIESDTTVFLTSNALGTDKVTISEGYTLDFASWDSDITVSTVTPAGFSIKDTTAIYKTEKITAGYKLSDDAKSISYTATTSGGNTLVTITGLKSGTSASQLSMNDKTVTLAEGIISDSGASVNGDGYTFVLSSAGKLTNLGTTATLKGSSEKDNLIGGTGNDYLEGGKGDDSINLSNAAKNLVKYASDDGKDVIYGFGTDDTLNITNGEISNSVISGEDLILTVDDGSITLKDVKNSILKLKLADGSLTTLKAAEENSGSSSGPSSGPSSEPSSGPSSGPSSSDKNYKWTISGTTATYGNSDKTLATITGLKSGTKVKNISLNEKTVTLNAATLGTNTVKITGSYNLALADDVKKPMTTKAGFSVNGTTATYKSKKTTAGYTLASNGKSISYSAESGGETLFNVSGLKKNTDASNLTLKNKTVTLKAAALGTTKVEISNGYTLALANDISKSKITKAGFSVSGTNAEYKTAGKTAGYTLSSDKKSVSYTVANSGSTLVKLNGLKSGVKANNLSLKNKVVTLSKNSIGTDIISATGDGYIFVLKSNGKLKNAGKTAILKGSSGKDTLIGGSGKDTLLGGNGNDSLTGGKGNDNLNGGNGVDTLVGGAGNDTLTGGKGKDIFVYAKGDGKDIITDYTAGQDKIKISSGSISKTKVSGKDVIFTVGSGSITVKNGKDQKISVVDSKGKTTTKTYNKNVTANVSDLWFAEENNFVTSDNISEITENNLTPTALEKISTTNFENLVQENNFVTYSEK